MKKGDEIKSPEVLESLLKGQLFDVVPFGVMVIDKKMNIITANRNFKEYFGKRENKRCYEVCKGLKKQCPQCNATRTFEDGQVRISDETGIDRHGRTCHYVVHVAPLFNDEGKVQYVVEMTTDMTETRIRQREYNLLFERVPCFITIIDRDFKIIRANEKFRDTFGDARGKYCYNAYKNRETPCDDCPAAETFKDGEERVATHTGVSQDGGETHYIVTTAPLGRSPGEVAHVIEISADISQVKALEKEMLDAERLAAVGQTVAGLAHTIKNLLMGLEGGMYIMDSGLKHADAQRIAEGWDVLQRNFNKTVAMVKGFLSFAKGKLPVLKETNVHSLANAIVELYRNTAKRQGVRLVYEGDKHELLAPLDPDGIEACLTNLVSNAIDAAMMRELPGACVTIKTYEKDNAIIFEVSDNGYGMDWEVKQKVFTTFFTTKASKGTGLGLLTTKKIIQEHGGTIEVDSEVGVGSTFRIRLPRERLKLIAAEVAKGKSN